MTEQDLYKYVAEQLKAGIEPKVIKMALETEGITETQINQAVAAARNQPAEPAPPSPKISSAPEPVKASSLVSLTAPGMPHTIARPRSMFKSKTLWITLLVVLLLGAGGAYAYMYLIPPSPEKIKEKMWTNFSNVKSLDFSGTVNGRITTENSGERNSYSGELKFNNSADLRDANNPKTNFDLEIVAEGFIISLETRVIDKTTFFKIKQFPGLALAFEEDLTGQWIRFNKENLLNLSQETSGVALEPKQISSEQLEEIKRLYLQTDIIQLGKKLGKEKIDGETTLHYEFAVNKANLTKFIKDFYKLVIEEYPEYQGEFADADSVIDQFISSINTRGGEVWFSPKDYLPRRVKFSTDLVYDMGENSKITLTLDVDLTYKNFNKQVDIKAPETFRDYTDVMSGPQSKTRDAIRIGHVRQIQTAMELYYNDNSIYPPALNGKPDPTFKPAKGTAFSQLLETYPTYPTPSGPPPCDDNVIYTYARVTNNSYKIGFCLENDTAGFSAGDHEANESGIK